MYKRHAYLQITPEEYDCSTRNTCRKSLLNLNYVPRSNRSITFELKFWKKYHSLMLYWYVLIFPPKPQFSKLLGLL